MLNVNGKNDDSYRYKMPSIKSFISGKGNGIQTNITNLNDVCKYINQPPMLILKFISVFNGAMAIESKMSITGSYTNEDLQKVLQVYINRFVICPKCGVPETVPILKKENKKNVEIELKCSSCGTQSQINYNNKQEMKASEIIIKYLEKNEWSINKGTMVKNNSKENINDNHEEIDDELNPF